MDKLKILLFPAFAVLLACSAPKTEHLEAEEIKSVMTRVCDWQLENLKDSVINRAEIDKVEPIRDDGWLRGTFYAGVMAQYHATLDSKYRNAVMAWGEKNNWLPGPKPRHADDQTVAQVYAEIYFINRDEKVLEGILQNYELMIEEPMWGPEVGWSKAKNWSWCDAIFMAPPGMARIAKATGEEKYLDLMNKLFWDTYEYIYDREEKLFYRDINYKADRDGYQLRSPNGKKIFWGRGNGWVLAGLARTLEYLPKDYPDYSKYVNLFREMAEQIAMYQQEDGLWRSSLNDPGWFPNPETSSSAMFCFGMASGVNNGFLDPDKYTPIINKAWKGLVSCVEEDGRLGWVQVTGHDPRIVHKHETVEYGSGAFLLAGNEMLKLHKGHRAQGQQEKTNFEIQQITAGPKHHMFGYIGHALTIPWNKDDRYILALRTDFFTRMPVAGEYAEVVMIDTKNENEVIPLDKTFAWNLQQGTMFYWNPNKPETQFFFNDLDTGTGLVFTVLYDIEKRKRIREYRFGNESIANGGVSPGGQYFVGINYGKISRSREIIQYAGASDWTLGMEANPETDGLFKIEISSGERELLVSYKTLAELLDIPDDYPIYVHHTLWNRNNNRIAFVVRGKGENKYPNTACVIHSDGTGLSRIKKGGHPEWVEGNLLSLAGDECIELYDVDTKLVTGSIGDTGTFPNPGGDKAYSPDGKWYVGGQLETPNTRAYSFYRMEDGAYFISPGIPTKADGGVTRIDGAPRWNRASDAILVPGLADDGSRQLFIIRICPGNE